MSISKSLSLNRCVECIVAKRVLMHFSLVFSSGFSFKFHQELNSIHFHFSFPRNEHRMAVISDRFTILTNYPVSTHQTKHIAIARHNDARLGKYGSFFHERLNNSLNTHRCK